jgi:CubicO group peptidase (beta-lactamase class C family)
MHRRSFLGSLLLPLLPAPALAAAAARDLGDAIEPVRARYGLPALAAAVTRAGTVVAAGATGVRVLGGDSKVTIDDRFHLGSDTKAMTATLAGMLVDAGRLQWTSTIGDVLGDVISSINPALAAVTLEQLLSHTSGIPSDTEEIAKLYFSTDAFSYNLAEQRLRAVTAWRDHAPATPPGKEFHYANLGYITAGVMIEKTAGMPWEQLITERVFAPLRLATAGIGPQATTGRIDAPVGHQVGDDGKVTPILWGPAADGPPIVGPAGTAHMSVLDFATWADWNAGGGRRGPALVKPDTLALIHKPRISTGKLAAARPGTPDEGEYALGWGVLKFDWAKAPVLTHNGSNSMNLAKILVDPGEDAGIVALTNFPGTKADDALNELTAMLYKEFVAG